MKRFATLLALFVFAGAQLLQAQEVQITGNVTSAEDGSSLPGVSIVVLGTTIGTVTDFEGNYNLAIPSDASALIFSFVGMKTQEIAYTGQTTIDVVMEPDILNLEEIIVTGYTTRTRNSLTGSTIQVKSEDISDIPVVSVDQTLQGKVAGLTIATTSGTPGSFQNIRIRGVGSLTAGNEPLFVIDGVPVINSNMSGSSDLELGTGRSSLTALSSINSNDIETITVLKDASATSAYGARGSNGVIVITTKKGKVGRTSFTLNANYGFQNKATEGKDVLTGAQRRELYLDGVFNTYGAANGFDRAGAAQWARDQGFSGIAKYDAWEADGAKEGNWEEAMKNKNAPMMNVNLSATGGDNTQSFYASVGYNKTEGTVYGVGFKRINGSLNYNRALHKRVKFSTSNSVAYTDQNNPLLEQAAYFANPNLSKYFMPPIDQPKNEDGTPNIDNLSTSLFNWLYLADHNVTFNHLTRALSNSYLEWEIIDNLKFKTLISFDYMLNDYKNYQNRKHGDAVPENGYSYRKNQRNVNMVAQNSLSYDLNLNDHRFNFLALLEYQTNEDNILWGEGENFSTDGLTNVDQAGANFDAGSSVDDWYNASYLGMVNYNYQGKYIADATFRREGSSKFAPDKRFGNFWSLGGAWNLSQESFMSGLTFVDNLRVRVSYGVSGNTDVGINQYQALLSYDADYFDQGAVYPSEFGNSNLTWEKNKNFDVGLDFAVVDGRVSGSFSWFNKSTFDLLQDVPLSRTTGHNNFTQNVGAIQNTGIEGVLNVDILRTSNYNVSLYGNFATLKNEVTELAKDANGEEITIETGTRIIETGRPIYEWYIREWAGVDPDNGDPLWYESEEGDATTTDYNVAEKRYMGKSATPTLTGGFGLHADAYGVFFDVNFYFAGGHKVYEDWARYTHDNGRYTTDIYQGVAGLVNSWRQPGDQTDWPRIEHGYNPNFASHTSSRFLYDGDYIRMKDLVFGYNFPQSLVSAMRVGGLQVYVRANNMWTWVKDDKLKYDPEVRADGFTYLTTPPVKAVIFGLNLKF